MKKKKIRRVLAIIIFVIGIITAIYVGGYVMFVKAILTACAAFDAGTLTANIVGITVIKCLLASTVAGVIVYVSTVISAIVDR